MLECVADPRLSTSLSALHDVFACLRDRGLSMNAGSVKEFVSALAILTLRARKLEHENERLSAPPSLAGVVALQAEAAEMRGAVARGEALLTQARSENLRRADQLDADLIAFARRGEPRPPKEFEAIATNVVDMRDYFGPSCNDNAGARNNEAGAPLSSVRVEASIDGGAVEQALRQIAQNLGEDGVVRILEDRP